MREAQGEGTRLYELARAYRRTVLLLGGSWLATALLSGARGVVGGLATPILLTIAVLLAVQGARLARELGLSLPAGWGVLLLVPLVNLVALLALSRKAMGRCRAHGVRVGLLGPRLEDLERLADSDMPRATVRRQG